MKDSYNVEMMSPMSGKRIRIQFGPLTGHDDFAIVNGYHGVEVIELRIVKEFEVSTEELRMMYATNLAADIMTWEKREYDLLNKIERMICEKNPETRQSSDLLQLMDIVTSIMTRSKEKG